MKENLWVRFRLCFLIILVGYLSACKKSENTTTVTPSGKVIFLINHKVDGDSLKENEMIYTNSSGNVYMITEVKYFISDITFYRNDGMKKVMGEWKDLFYVDENLPDTRTIRFFDQIPAGTYDSINFVFGISQEKNKSFMFVDPPEVNMFWPEILGGGYHYMMINGKWKDTTGFIQPFNFHLGIGQLYHGNTYNVDSIYAFVQNYFTVTLPGSAFIIEDTEQLVFQLTMNIESWFKTPHIYDHNFWGGAIMQNQPAMQMAKENGWDIFSITQLQ